MRLAKIVATLGPASQNPEMIHRLLQGGVNLFRLNFSHGNHDVLEAVIREIREASHQMSLTVGILGDLQGPKIRIGELEGHTPVMLVQGSTVRFSAENVPGNAQHVTTNTPQLLEELKPGDEVLMDDGLLELRVLSRVSPMELLCEVVTGGVLSEKKGINVPGLKMKNIPALTDKDQVDAKFALEQGLDYLALSFVRSAADIIYLRQFIETHLPQGKRPPFIVSKIEKPQALEDIDAIIAESDALMVARGDLGVELRPEKVPMIQKMLIQKCNDAEKPVITATQMLESMILHATPTRAEVSDVANAVFDGSDALMLSGESAAGKYPLEAVQTMGRIITEAEAHFREWHRFDADMVFAGGAAPKMLQFHQAIAQAACYAAQKAYAKAIVVISFSGKMATRISKRKPQLPIIALSPHRQVCRQLNLLWGVYPLHVTAYATTEEILRAAEEAIFAKGLLQKGDPIVLCAGQTHLTEMTNSLKIYHIGELAQPPSPVL